MDRRDLFRIAGTAGIGVVLSEQGRANDHHASGGAKPIMPPLQAVHLHFCGIHVAKRDPKFQIITQHYCAGITDEMHQCLLYDSDRDNARLLGVEYIISDRMYRELPEAEKRYWHPHTYEVLAGGLIGPEMSADDEMKFMKYILTTWGKTWHTWPDPSSSVPMGEPLLMWSLMADDQVDKEVLAKRDRDFKVSASHLRAMRTKEIGHDPPQIPFPQSVEEIGRQWTADGEDKPPTRK